MKGSSGRRELAAARDRREEGKAKAPCAKGAAAGARQRVSRAALVLFAVLFAVMAAFPLVGCKYTDVLTEHIEDEELGVLDPDAEPIYVNTPGAPEDPNRMSSVESESDRIDDQNASLPEYDEESADNATTEQREHEEDSAEDDNASTGDEQSEDEGDSTAIGEGEVQGEAGAGTGDGTGPSQGQTPEPTPDDGPEGAVPPTGGAGGPGQTYDASGTTVELPENVNSVAAVGDYATIVQMLAGQGGLAATDASWIARVAERGVFPGEGVESLPAAWTGSRETGYTVDMGALVAAAPDAVLVDNSCVSFTPEQTQQLSDAGIDCVVVPAIGMADTSDVDIVSAVSVVGELLKSAPTAYDTSAMVSAWVAQHDEAVANCLSANGGYSFKMVNGVTYPGIYQGTSLSGESTTQLTNNRRSTAYIDAWTYDIAPYTTAIRSYSGARLYLDGEAMDSAAGAGVSVASGSENFILLDYYLQVSGVVNNSYEGPKPVAS